jgi:Cu+-exporting ATPase
MHPHPIAPTLATQHIELNVKGMTCTNCALGIEKYLQKEGLTGVNVDFSHEEVNFDLPDHRSLPPILKGIERLGFEVVKEENLAAASQGLSKVERYFYLSLIGTVPLLAHMFLSWHWLHNPWVQLAFATPVFLIGLWHFGRSGWSSLKTGVPNMDVLITVGTVAAYGYSLYGTVLHLGPDFLFYETAASIISLVLLGNVMEHRAVQQTTSAVKDLTRLRPQRATRIHLADQQEVLQSVPVSQVAQGDHLQVNSGDRIPVDGRIEAGQGEVDESMLTGESLPVSRQAGDEVVGGSLLVSGSLRMQATRVGKEGTLAQIIDLVKKAQADKPDLQQLADRVSAIFVPAVLGISLLTFGLSYLVFGLALQAAIIHSVAVLVIACPCAMGLATPTAVVVGIGRASRQGLLIKGGRTLEQFAGIKRVVFDKTGTLTTGAFQLEAIHAPASEQEAVRQVIMSLEQYSSHPIARSLSLALAGTRPLPLHGVNETKGVGLVGQDEAGHQYQLGAYRIAQGLTNDRNHSLYLLRDGRLWATVDLKDDLREGAKAAIAYLQGQGIETVLLSGDQQQRCEEVGRALGIDLILGEQLPDEKLRRIEAYSQAEPTAMVGDGINDAPALARATVGISLGSATDIAMQSAQVVMLQGRLSLLPELHRISVHTLLTIKQNLFWAFFYNVIAIPAAAMGFLQPIIAAAAMAFSDVIVVGNSLRLRIKRLGNR